jgi:dienelactone hydrolase
MNARVICTAICTAMFNATFGTTAFAQSFQVSPANPVLIGDTLSIVLNDPPSDKPVTITAERVIESIPGSDSNKRVLYRSEATFAAKSGDKLGKLDLSKVAPQKGSYRRAEANGLFWSMTPQGNAPEDRKPNEVRITAIVDGKPIATTTVSFVQALPDIKIEKVEQFPGAIFANSTAAGKRPVVILLGGSEGGSALKNRGAAPLASRGFAVLTLPYYSPKAWPSQKAEHPELPAAFADIAIDRLNDAREWLIKREKTHGDIDASRIALHGTSKGAEFVLLAGVHMQWVTSIVALVPSDVVWEGWGENVEPGKRSSFSYKGKPFASTPYSEFGQEFMGFQTNEPVRIRRPLDKGRAANPEAAAKARIPVEKIKAPVMVIGGQEDQVWNSAMMAHNIAERRAEAKLDTVSLVYTDAGHWLGGHGYTPTTRVDDGPMKSGGTPEGNAAAQADAWPKTIAFLKRTLAVK